MSSYQDLHQLLFETASDAILILDGERFVDCNPATLKMMRVDSKEKLLNVDPAELSPVKQPDGRLSSEKSREMIGKALEQGTWRFEWLHRRMDGEEFPVEVTLIAVPFEGRQVLFTEWREITRQKEMEQQIQDSLRHRERQLRLSSEVAQEIVTVAREEDLYGRIVTSVMQQLDCSHAQLFRCRTDMAAARLAAGDTITTSEILAPDFELSIGNGSVGAVMATGSTIFRSNIRPVAQDEVLSSLLPDAKDEIVVPIKVGREDVEAQLRGVDFFINSNFDGLALYPIDAEAINPLSRKAVNQGLRVVSLNTDMGTNSQTHLIQYLDHEMGYQLGVQAGHWAKKHIPAGQKLKLGILNYRFNPQVRIREEGIVAGLKAAFGDNFEIVGSEQATDPAQGVPVAERWLRTYSDLKMIVGINDGGALGAHRAVIAAGKDDPATFFVGGIDATEAALEAIKQGGSFQATVDIKPGATGVLLVRMLLAAIKDQPCPPLVSIQPAAVNAANLQEFLLSRQDKLDIPEAYELAEGLTGCDFDGIRLGLSVLDLNNPYFSALAEGARKEASRLGVDLIINDPKQVLGILAIQSESAGVLRREDQLVLEGLAAQLATAFESLRLRREMEERLTELSSLQRLMTREGWREFSVTQLEAGSGYLFDQMATRRIEMKRPASAGNGQSQIDGETSSEPDSVIRPLAISGESIGSLGVYDDPEHPLTPEDQAFLDEVAAQVAEALERARLLEQSQRSLAVTEEQARRLALLTELSRDLAEANTREEAFTVVATRIVEIVEGDRASIALVKPDTGKFEVHALSGLKGVVPTGAELPIAGTAVGRAILENRPVLVSDAGASEYLDARHLASQGVRSTLNAPLVAGGEVIGTVNVGSTKPNSYSEQDERLMVQVASLLASTVENRRLFEQTRAALAEVEATQRRYTLQAWEAYQARHRVNTYEEVREGVIPLQGVLPPETRQALAQQKPVALSSTSVRPVNGDDEAPAPADAKSSLIVPLKVRDAVIGVLGLQETEEEREWTPEEIALVEAISEQVAQAAEQLRLFDDTQQRAARERRVNEIGDRIQAAQSLEEALRIAVQEVGISLKSPQTMIQLEVD